MSGQQKFQIVSSGRVQQGHKPAQVLAHLTKALSVSPEQARRLFVKGWVIKDQLPESLVGRYRQQLQQFGLQIEVHPAGKFDNRTLAAQKGIGQSKPSVPPVGGGAEKTVPETAESQPAATHASPRTSSVSPGSPVKSATSDNASDQTTASPSASHGPRQQVEALFDDSVRELSLPSLSERIALLMRLPLAAMVPLLFLSVGLLFVYQAGVAVWGVVSAVLAGELGAGTLVGSAVALVLLTFAAALLLMPYYRARPKSLGTSKTLQKQDAPGLFLVLEVLGHKLGVPVPQSVKVVPGAETSAHARDFSAHLKGQVSLTLGLSAAATLNGGDNLALIARSLSFHQTRLTRVAAWLLLVPLQRLQWMHDALERESSVLAAEDGSAPRGLLKPLHRLLSAAGLALVPVIERLQSLHRAATAGLGRVLARRADSLAATVIGSTAFADFAHRWQTLVHADLVTGEINREARLLGKRLSDYPAAVRWLFNNLDAETRAGIEAAMDDDSDVWELAEPATSGRVVAVEEQGINAVLARANFSLVKLFADFNDLCAQISRDEKDGQIRAVDNHLLMSTSKEVEEARRVLAEYFNRVLPQGVLALCMPSNEELRQLDLQETIDWLRSRLVDLRELEQRQLNLQASAAKIQLGAALVRSQVKVDPAHYNLTGLTPAAAEQSRKQNREQLREYLQQTQPIWSMFYQRMAKTMALLNAGGQSRAQTLRSRLAAFDHLREPLGALAHYADVVGELVERVATDKLPPQLQQKYANLALQQGETLLALVREHGEALGPELQARVEGLAQANASLANEGQVDLVGQLQGIELRCKHLCAAVLESYHQVLAELLQLCLGEEKRRGIRPLKLAAAV